MFLEKLIGTPKEYEKIEFICRRHIATFLPKIFLFLFLLATPWIVYFLISLSNPYFFQEETKKVAGLFFLVGFYLFSTLLFLTLFVDYFLDVWVVTNERIIDIRQEGIFSRTVAETRFYLVQDVTSERKGVFQTIFNYGNVYVQTAAEKGRFVFENVPNPFSIAQKIMTLVEKDKPYHEEKIKLLNLETRGKILAP